MTDNITPLEENLALLLLTENLLKPDQPAIPAAKIIIQWMAEEFDRQVNIALNCNQKVKL